MIDLIYDCDLTMGLPNRDVDDGLALLYLLGSPNIRLRGITSTFGNSSIEEVHPCLLAVLEDIGRSDIPAFRGASRDALGTTESSSTAPVDRDPRADSDAARYLAKTVADNPGIVSILATGSPTNLLGAFRLYPDFFHDLKQMVFMGGITESLIINGREMAELNLASDPEAALFSLYAGAPPPQRRGSSEEGLSSQPRPRRTRCDIAVITGNLCLQVLLTRKRFDEFIRECRSTDAKRMAAYLEEKILPWFAWVEKVYDLPGFHAWDATAAMYLTDPQLFEPQKVLLSSSLEDLQRGFLRTQTATGKPVSTDAQAQTFDSRHIDIPSKIRNQAAYWRRLFQAWHDSIASHPE